MLAATVLRPRSVLRVSFACGLAQPLCPHFLFSLGLLTFLACALTPFTDEKKPCWKGIGEKEPYIDEKEPYIAEKEPCVDEKEP